LVHALVATAETVAPPVPPAPASHPHEAEILLSWLEQPGVRIVDAAGPWACPVRSAAAHVDLATTARDVARHGASTAPDGDGDGAYRNALGLGPGTRADLHPDGA